MTDTKTVGPGTVLAGRYEIAEVVGHGGFGTVYKARQLNMDRDVAVKILPPQFLVVKDVVERFKREARLASRLRHPNTITLHDYGQQDNLLYIVMELLVGEDLADLLKREGRLPPERILLIARQVLKSLSEAHEHHIVHRDLKPENIFLSVVGDDRDHVKVLDFGIAKLAHPSAEDDAPAEAARLTMSGSTVGTPTYMSPEQAAGEAVDGTTDLYALGIIMYEMANGRPPFHHKDPVRVMRSQIFDPVPPMRDPKLRGSIIDRVIQKALAKNRDQRFDTANEMLLALAGEPVARPMIQGISMSVLDEPSTQELQPEDLGPITDDFRSTRSAGNAVRSTALGFARSPSEVRAEDAIPFGSVEPARRSGERERASVRSDISARGTSPPRSLRDSPSSTSSIISVIEDAPSEEPILLTRKKADTPVLTATKQPRPAPAAKQPQQPQQPQPAQTPAAQQSAPAKAARESEPPTGLAASSEWEWEPSAEVERSDERQVRARVPAWLVVLMVGLVFLLLLVTFQSEIAGLLGQP